MRLGQALPIFLVLRVHLHHALPGPGRVSPLTGGACCLSRAQRVNERIRNRGLSSCIFHGHTEEENDAEERDIEIMLTIRGQESVLRRETGLSRFP